MEGNSLPCALTIVAACLVFQMNEGSTFSHPYLMVRRRSRSVSESANVRKSTHKPVCAPLGKRSVYRVMNRSVSMSKRRFLVSR